ncbi:MAG: hypothetical protein AB1726_01120 [Planctomycetota bacterium]
MDRGDPARLVGVDGGASTVRAWRLERGPSGLAAAGPAARRPFPTDPPFLPVPLARQLAERAEGSPRLGAAEEARGELVLAAAAEAIAAVAGPPPADLVLGIAMPGLPDAGGRGILVLRHGARLPRFLDRLAARLAERGLGLAGAPARLVADGRAAGFGEAYAAGGALVGVGTALYMAGGTGVADALRLGGRFPPGAEVRRWLPAAWQLSGPGGRPFEDLVSMAGINARWAERSGATEPRVEAAARSGDGRARAVLAEAAGHLAAFLAARLAALHRGPLRGGRGEVERLVLGQRTADLFLAPDLAPWFAAPLEKRLAEELRAEEDPRMRAAYLARGALRPGLLVASALHAAPAAGAVAAALGLVEGEP